ncbi:MAG: NAD(P)/FAD-dependent oxidoreductase [Candidatus Helarchaeota archaeon]|nr:NAD(P)/FAD-dependent oxidoreductase [Candidatus Helarchaeota archaeon]
MKADAIVVGAGPAGSTCAIELAKNGAHVILLEKSAIGRYKPCAGGLLGANEEEFGKLPNSVRQQSINQVVIGTKDRIGKMNPIHDGEKFGTLVYRTEYDRYLAESAQSAGAELYTETEAISANRFNDRIEVETISKNGEKNTFLSNLLVIATGLSSSKIQRSLGVEYPRETVNCVQAEFTIADSIIEERFGGGDIEIYWDAKGIASHGYAWIFTKPGGLTVGVLDYFIKVERLKKIIKKHPAISPRLQGAQPLLIEKRHYWAASIPDRISEYTYYPRTLVIGDAAGFVDRMNYEGIYYARKSGKIAAEVILKAISRKNFSAAYLGRYEKRWNREIYLPYLLDSRFTHHFYYHSSYLDEFAKAVVDVLNDETVIKKLYQEARKNKEIKYLYKSEIFQLEMVKKLQETYDKETFNDMYKHFIHENPV